MEEDFYRGRLESRHGLSVLTPPADQRELVHGVIYGELCLGTCGTSRGGRSSRSWTASSARGAQGVILGCTEIGLLLRQEDAPVPLFDTAHDPRRGRGELRARRRRSGTHRHGKGRPAR